MGAKEIGEVAVATISARAAERDSGEGERSMASAVKAFNAMTSVGLTETEGWLFMVLLKISRSRRGKFVVDDYIDGAAYMMLAGECEQKLAEKNKQK